MTMDAATRKTITLLQKLQALAQDKGATEAEAQLALQKMQEIMADANLTMASLEAAGKSSGSDGNRVKDGLDNRTVYNWQKQLMQQIAELNSVHCMLRYVPLRHTKQFNGYQLIGREANIASTRVMFQYLVQAIDRLARERAGDPKLYFTKDACLFREGCADRVIERLNKRHKDIVDEQDRKAREELTRSQHPAAATGSALVVVMSEFYQDEKDLNEDMVKGLDPGTTGARRREYEREQEEARIERKRKFDAAIAEGMSESVAYYVAAGWSRERAEEILAEAARPSKPETDAQRRKREERERNSNNRYWEQQHREGAKYRTAGYQAGHAAGEDVGLDQQVDQNTRNRLK